MRPNKPMTQADTDKKRVLIVDDSKIVRASLTKHLKDRFLVREAENGEQGWEALLLDPGIQVVICDLMMPVMDGYALLDKIRSSKVKRIRTIPFIVISGADDDENSQLEAVDHGANDFVSKNAGAIELLARLESMLELGRTQRALSESREALSKNAAFDPIMQMATPHFLDMQLDMMWSFARRHNTDIALLCIRIDRPSLGQQAQNHNLFSKLEVAIGELLGKTVRKEDCVARTAEGEFNIAAAGITQQSAEAFAQRLLHALAKADLKKFGNDVNLSISIGIASLRHDRVNTLYELRALAHDRVEEAQKLGGNQIQSLPNGKHELPPALETQIINAEKAVELLNGGELGLVLPHVERLRRELHPLLQLFEQLH
ncbi:response regulator [Parvibium lacunae]|uniref:Response regulator n=1 Tax=Parvibium lacunae TaxID=1888893 RepID=A0A368L6H1_9BURK|nr:response regulator [Parvibium lacunae]RCS59288.1 response regulator [Parvibium lacunae]